MTKKRPQSITVNFDRRVLEWILSETSKHPESEEGGKYIGHMKVSEIDHDAISVTINDFLPGGPRAKRTAVEFMPDGEYQESLFRQVERLDSDVEHLGSWHTHHCYGLDRLSSGDIKGYFRTVNKRDYRPNIFVASLVKFIPRHPKSESWIDHFLFVRGDDNYYTITNEVRLTSTSPLSLGITGHGLKGESDVSIGDMPLASQFWFETEVGRNTLAGLGAAARAEQAVPRRLYSKSEKEPSSDTVRGQRSSRHDTLSSESPRHQSHNHRAQGH